MVFCVLTNLLFVAPVMYFLILFSFFFQDKSSEPWIEKFKNDDGIELMIPAYNKNLIPDILLNWIRSKEIDIKSEYVFKLLALSHLLK